MTINPDFRPSDYKARLSIDQINAKPMEQLRFKHFANLKSGRDKFSRLKLAQLREMISAEAYEAVVAEFGDGKTAEKCLRWICRGLNSDKAIRKVHTDLEIGGNATDKRLLDDRTPEEKQRDRERTELLMRKGGYVRGPNGGWVEEPEDAALQRAAGRLEAVKRQTFNEAMKAAGFSDEEIG